MSLLEAEKKAEERRKVVANERAKLTASYVNTVAGSVFGIGGLAPIFAVLYAAGTPSVPVWVVIGISLVCSAASVSLHIAARRYLRELV
ncbi:hypothetical protein [Methylobacterium pseudosasicola]|uniref:Uncharacterized protein n=1 Tax=Methylobacterium pseudosasicola TaxID=582667 RepID=A0A1I4M3R4_9HYPH|nr:hypothetical protein [Methylobacterium pseudosasicola]SFL97819.1 hypothetical protein SAMN05192568_101579 [Methylobacterium pseudosasicola]